MNSQRNGSRQGSGQSRCPGCTLTSCLLCKQGRRLRPIPKIPGDGSTAEAHSPTLQGCSTPFLNSPGTDRKLQPIPKLSKDVPVTVPVTSQMPAPHKFGALLLKNSRFLKLYWIFPGSSQRQSCPHPLGGLLPGFHTPRPRSSTPAVLPGSTEFHQNPGSRTRNSHRFRGAAPEQPLPMLPLPGKAHLEHSRPSRYPRIPPSRPRRQHSPFPELLRGSYPRSHPRSHARISSQDPFPGSSRAQAEHQPG